MNQIYVHPTLQRSQRTPREPVHVCLSVAFHCIVTTMNMEHIVETMSVNTTVAFDTTVVFVIIYCFGCPANVIVRDV
jgi:hypothetical protein